MGVVKKMMMKTSTLKKLNIFSTIGVQRSALFLFSLLLVCLSFFPENGFLEYNFQIIPSMIAPILSAIMIFVWALDIIMALIFKTDATESIKQRYNVIIKVDLSSLFLLGICWVDFIIPKFTILLLLLVFFVPFMILNSLIKKGLGNAQ